MATTVTKDKRNLNLIISPTWNRLELQYISHNKIVPIPTNSFSVMIFFCFFLFPFLSLLRFPHPPSSPFYVLSKIPFRLSVERNAGVKG